MNETERKPMSKWIPESDPKLLRRIGKTGEELSELHKVIDRIVIQGYGGVDPETDERNCDALTKEIADVYAQLDETVLALELDRDYIEKRREVKREMMTEWESMFNRPQLKIGIVQALQILKNGYRSTITDHFRDSLYIDRNIDLTWEVIESSLLGKESPYSLPPKEVLKILSELFDQDDPFWEFTIESVFGDLDAYDELPTWQEVVRFWDE